LTAVQAAFPDVSIGSYPIHGPDGWTVRLTFKGLDPERVERAAVRARSFLD
jgi:hypothetical protein